MAIDSDGELYDSDEVVDYDEYRRNRDRPNDYSCTDEDSCTDGDTGDSDDHMSKNIRYRFNMIRCRGTVSQSIVGTWHRNIGDAKRDMRHEKGRADKYVTGYTKHIEQYYTAGDGDIDIVDGTVRSWGSIYT